MSGTTYTPNYELLPDFLQSLQPASYAGVPFGVFTSEYTAGRKTIIHPYPFKNLPYVEDLGAANQFIRFDAYIVGDDVFDQQANLEQVWSMGGTNELVHPSLGSVQANLITYSLGSASAESRIVNVRCEFVLTNALQEPGPFATADTMSDVDNDADDLDDSANDDFATDLGDTILQVTNGVITAVDTAAYAVGAVVDTVALFATTVQTYVNDAALIGNLAQGVGFAFGAAYSVGRYANGNLTTAPVVLATLPGGLPPQALLVAATSLLVASNVNNRAMVSEAAQTALGAVQSGLPVPTALQTLTEALRTGTAAPSDQIRLLSELASFTAPTNANGSPIGTAIAGAIDSTSAVCRRAALSSLARAYAAYQPTSQNDGQRKIDHLKPLYLAEIEYASSVGDSFSASALKRLLASIIADLSYRSGGLNPIQTYTLPASITCKRLAMRLYGSADYEASILFLNPNIINPLFSGMTLEVLRQ